MTKKIVKKIVNLLWPHRFQFAKYFVIGISGFALDMISLVMLKELFGVNPTISVVVNQIFLMGYNFTLNKYWTFRNRDMPHKQFVRYAALAAANYLLSVLAMYIFNERLDLDYRLVRVGTLALMVSWNFLLFKFWVYKS